MMEDLLRQIFLRQQIISVLPDQAHPDERRAQTNLLKQPIKSAFPDEAHHDERPATTNLLKPANKICTS